MAELYLRLRYDGLGASLGRMPPSQERQITDGAQMFLGAHAYYFTERRIPHAVMDRSVYFEINDVRIQRGSWDAYYVISLHTAAIWGLLPDSVKDAARDVAQDFIKEQFKGFIKDSVDNWRKRKTILQHPLERIEPVLTFGAGANAPAFDFSAEEEMQRQKLFDRTDRSMSSMSRPIGYAASHCEVWIDEEQIHLINRRTMSEQDIVDGLKPLQSRLGLRPGDGRVRRDS